MLELETRLIDRDVTFNLTPETACWLGETGYDDSFGACPLARVIQDKIKNLADEIPFGKLKNGGTVRVLLDRKKDKLAFEFITDQKPTPQVRKAKKSPKKKVHPPLPLRGLCAGWISAQKGFGATPRVCTALLPTGLCILWKTLTCPANQPIRCMSGQVWQWDEMCMQLSLRAA